MDWEEDHCRWNQTNLWQCVFRVYILWWLLNLRMDHLSGLISSKVKCTPPWLFHHVRLSRQFCLACFVMLSWLTQWVTPWSTQWPTDPMNYLLSDQTYDWPMTNPTTALTKIVMPGQFCALETFLYRSRKLDIPVCTSNVSAVANQLYLRNQVIKCNCYSFASVLINLYSLILISLLMTSTKL